ncbi:amino acid adenylation domain-containing protein [Nonomuraea sp. H19]|uniref:non-ribosomal peptide synthetase n=1 Tax=Nonomuraea sp. H19 TaxID=3452206 RepID=UPI003F8B0DA2
MTSESTAVELIAELRREGVRLWEEAGRLRYRAPKGILTADRLEALRAAKESVLARLRGESAEVAVTPDPGARFEPFPLTDVQAAYLVGRTEAVRYGGVACHVYLEVNYPDLDPQRVEAAWNRLIERHDMLRVVVSADGYQRVLPAVEHLTVAATDLRGAPEARVGSAFETVRAEMGHRVYDTTRWPLFDLRVTRADERAVLHLSMDFLVADWASIWLLLGEFEALHTDPAGELPEPDLRFRDYLLAELRLRETDRYQRDRDYWMARLDDLPPAPELPVIEQTGSPPPVFRRRFLRLDSTAWDGLKRRAQKRGLTPTAAVLTAYAAVIERWSRSPRFSLNLTVLNRLPLHPHVPRVVGDFTSVSLLAVDGDSGASFAERATATSGQLFDDLDHRLCSGVEVLRELARRRGREAALMPVVFTSAIGLGDAATGERAAGRLDGFGITQTPQVFIDCQAMDDADGLQVNWDVREGVFPEGVAGDMFDAFEALLRRLATTDAAWDSGEPLPLPDWQERARARVNDTAAPLPGSLLHEAFLARAAAMPGRPAVVGPLGSATYGELAGRAAAVAAALREAGCGAGQRVAIVMEKGVDQVSAVLGTLLAGAVYLPVDTIQPPLRRAAILADAGVRHLLTQSAVDDAADWPDGVEVIAVDRLAAHPAPAAAVGGDPDAPAYVIYTSGSTGRPKGVVISHRAAGNTVADINRRFGVTADDRVLGLANLGFDLSVYDIFGPLSAGGALVYPDAGRRADPSHWAELIGEHGVTVWNSVPALMQMLVTYLDSEPALAPASLRLALLSGDWIPITLPDEVRRHMPGLTQISLGGATEAAIWSIYHPIGPLDDGWRSVPYGIPLANQGFRVLDRSMRDCPVWVAGELYISGAGLAEGYLGDEEQTAHRFVTHPVDGQRLYRTGDLGRYRPGGEIEFLGREDTQVKVRGHRIELGEIEAALLEHPAVAAAGVVVDDSGAERALLGVVETARVAVPDTPGIGRMGDLVRAAADRAAGGVRRDQVEAYVERLDRAVLSSMAYALHRLGVSTSGEEAMTAAGIDPRHHWLVRRWLDVLTRSGAIEGSVDGDTVARHWKDAAAAWTADLGSPLFLDYLSRNAERLPDLLTGRQDPVALLFPEGGFDVADSLYRENAMARYLNQAVAATVHRIAAGRAEDRPLRILEAGAGTGGTTQGVLAALAGFDVEYLFTDVSPYFLPEARSRYGEHPGISFGVFDVDSPCRPQGLAPNSYDVVLAAGVLENARDVEAALLGLTELVAPGGWLVITEPTREHPWILASQAFMMTPPEDARRTGGPSYLDRDGWLDLLAKAGAGDVLCLPGDDHSLAPQRLHMFAARMKGDRAPVTAGELAAFLAQRLPGHMVPAHLQIVDALPLTANGKVDRRTLAGWRPVSTAASPAAVEEPADAFEAALSQLWAAALALPGVGRTQSLFDCGADSLIMARMAGKLREEVPEAAGIPFDTLLRHMLSAPTVAALAAFLREPRQPEAGGRRRDGSNAVLVPFSERAEGPVRVLFHAGLGTMECFRPLAAELVAQDLGPVTGIVIADTDVYCALDQAEVVERLADDYAGRLLAEGHTRFQLVGYCLGGMYAVEVSRRLIERGAEVADLILVSSHPVLFDIDEDLMIETLFVPNLGLTMDQIGLGELDAGAAVRAFMHVMRANDGRMPAGSLLGVGGDPGLDEIAAFYRRLGAHPQQERFELYARAASAVAGQEMRPELVSGMFRVFRQSFRSARFTPEPYAGDIRFLRPSGASGFAPGMDDMTLDFWRRVCVGEFDLADIEGNHFTCITDPHVRQVAEHIARPLKEAGRR